MSDEKPDGYGVPSTERGANGLMLVVLVTTALMCVGSIGGAGWFAWRATQNVLDREREARENMELAALESERALTRANFQELANLIAAASRAGRLPQDVYDAQGKPLLSWRVTLLRESAGDQDLFRRFKLDESWDSPTNRPLIERMPKMYTPPPPATVGAGRTFSRGFSQEGAAFGRPKRPHLGTLPLSNISAPIADVLVVVDAGIAIEWTKPDQMVWNPGQKRPPLGGLVPDDETFLAISADGHVHDVRRSLADDTLRLLFETREEKRPGLRITGENR